MNFAITLAEQIFRGVCAKIGYSLEFEDSIGVLDTNFFTYLTESSIALSEELNVEPNDVLAKFSAGFASDEDIRLEIMTTYTDWLTKKIAERNEMMESEA